MKNKQLVQSDGRNNIYTYSLIHTYVWADTYIRAGSHVRSRRAAHIYA